MLVEQYITKVNIMINKFDYVDYQIVVNPDSILKDNVGLSYGSNLLSYVREINYKVTNAENNRIKIASGDKIMVEAWALTEENELWKDFIVS